MQYPNRFLDLGVSGEEIKARGEQIFQTIFYGSEEERFYHPVDPDMGYMEDTGNHDARTEGMSYGMMMCVQTDHQEEFDRIWKWTKTYMLLKKGPNKGYFCWSNGLDGKKNAQGPAPDGEEYFAMALIFASRRWGDKEGIFDYMKEAGYILHNMISKPDNWIKGANMFDRKNHLIRFVPGIGWSDPSYHLPHFYELFGQYAYPEDREFYLQAAKASREYLHIACHPQTGLSSEYAHFDGTPVHPDEIRWSAGERHDYYYSDAYRTIINIALDHIWFGKDEWQKEEGEKFLKFYCETLGKDKWDSILEIDGTIVEGKVLHPVAVIAANATASLLCDNENAMYALKKFWDTPLRTGDRRYYDNCLYFLAYLMLSGSYRIW